MRCDSTSEARPGDIFHPDFEQGLPTYFDLTVRNSLQPAYLIKTATCAGAAAEAGELEKDQRHDSLVSSTGSIIYPIVVESLGLWSPNSLQVLKLLHGEPLFTTTLLLVSVCVICFSNSLVSYGYTTLE